ncbi:hypothetical protein Bbelb_374250 [Branchiostoma belcheri]|nr:hypothetical protein Bbelb_374250 [Branchiostoma belcheri]
MSFQADQAFPEDQVTLKDPSAHEALSFQEAWSGNGQLVLLALFGRDVCAAQHTLSGQVSMGNSANPEAQLLDSFNLVLQTTRKTGPDGEPILQHRSDLQATEHASKFQY